MAKLKNKGLIIFAVVLVAVIVVALVFAGDDRRKPAAKPKSTASTCGPYRKDGIVTMNDYRINVEIAYSSSEKTKGLAGRPCILANQGMIFDFGRNGQYAFWMKGMNFPIDIIWINSAHNIAAIEVDVEPSTYHSKNPYFENDPQHPARYVLEVKANLAKQLHLDIGAPVQFQNT